MAGSHVVTLGTGTIIILVLWTIAALLWAFLYRSQSGTRYIVLLTVSLITLILVLLPTESGKPPEHLVRHDEDVYYDYMFIWKVFLIAFLALGIIVGAVINVTQYWTMTVHGSKPVPKRGSRLKQD